MSQNRSTAVMQRRGQAPDELDYFPTPPWATRALLRWLEAEGHPVASQSCWEPACGELHMARPLREAFGSVRASDVHPYSPDVELLDFTIEAGREKVVDWVVTNPPFLLEPHPPSTVLQFVERVAMFRGRVIENGKPDPFNIDPLTGEPRKASSATAYAWLVWEHGKTDTRLRWIPECRDRLQVPSDYPGYAEAWEALVAARDDGGPPRLL